MASYSEAGKFFTTTEVALFTTEPTNNSLAVILVPDGDKLLLPAEPLVDVSDVTRLDVLAVTALNRVMKESSPPISPAPWQVGTFIHQKIYAGIGYTAVARQDTIEWNDVIAAQIDQISSNCPNIEPLQKAIIDAGLASLRSRVVWDMHDHAYTLSILAKLLPSEFTMKELQKFVEAVQPLSRPLDRANFARTARHMARAKRGSAILSRVIGRCRETESRPAQLWRIIEKASGQE